MELAGRQIVGIVGDVRDGGLNRDPQPIMYVPWAQMPDAHSANLLDITPLAWIVRTRGEPHAHERRASSASCVRRAAACRWRAPRTMDEIVARSTARSDFNMMLLTVFAAVGAAAGGDRHLRVDGLLGPAADPGDRHPHGARRRAPTRCGTWSIRQGMSVALIGVAIGLASAFGADPR